MSFHIDWTLVLGSGPELFWRHRWNDYRERFGLPYSRGHMQNLDSEGRGPEKVKFGPRVAYRKEALISWLNNQHRQEVAE